MEVVYRKRHPKKCRRLTTKGNSPVLYVQRRGGYRQREGLFRSIDEEARARTTRRAPARRGVSAVPTRRYSK